MPEGNYVSGDDYVVKFLGYRFGFNTLDFEQRVNAAAVKLGLVDDEELDPGEIADLVEVTAEGRIEDPRSGLGGTLFLISDALIALRMAGRDFPGRGALTRSVGREPSCWSLGTCHGRPGHPRRGRR